MNPAKKLMSWLRVSSDPESAGEAQRLREDRNTIRISQNTQTTQLGMAASLAPTPDVLDPGSEDSHR
jgi:hypothetical protein